MSEEKGPKGEGRKKPIVVIAVIAVIIIMVTAVLALALLPPGNGTGSDGNVSTSIADMIIQPADLSAGWTIASPFYPGYQGTLPGDFSEAGGIGLNLTELGQEKMYLIVLLVKCANSSQVQQLWVGGMAVMNTTMPGKVHAADFADAAAITDLVDTGMGGSQGKYLTFIEKNMLCSMIFTFENGYSLTDQQLFDIASLQLEKIK